MMSSDSVFNRTKNTLLSYACSLEFSTLALNVHVHKNHWGINGRLRIHFIHLWLLRSFANTYSLKYSIWFPQTSLKLFEMQLGDKKRSRPSRETVKCRDCPKLLHLESLSAHYKSFHSGKTPSYIRLGQKTQDSAAKYCTKVNRN